MSRIASIRLALALATALPVAGLSQAAAPVPDATTAAAAARSAPEQAPRPQASCLRPKLLPGLATMLGAIAVFAWLHNGTRSSPCHYMRDPCE